MKSVGIVLIRLTCYRQGNRKVSYSFLRTFILPSNEQ